MKKKSRVDDEKLWHRHVKSRMSNLTTQDIKRTDIVAILDDVGEKVTPTQANRVQSLVSKCFRGRSMKGDWRQRQFTASRNAQTRRYANGFSPMTR